MTDAVDPPAERLLHDLGITEPGEIDVEVIACAAGAAVRYRRLAIGDARIVGLGDRAIITVDDRASRVRQRFSVAHELGHWHHHRGRRLICHGAADQQDGAAGCEREADGYAADLLMPRFMLGPLVAEVARRQTANRGLRPPGNAARVIPNAALDRPAFTGKRDRRREVEIATRLD